MASIDITTQSGAVGNGDLQLQNGAPMDATLRFVTDAVNTASPLKLSTSLVQTTSTLKITTNDNPYIDAEDGSGNNRFTVGRATSSQQVNVDFASNPAGSTTAVGAIRTFRDGTNLSEAMTFIEDGSVGIGTTAPVGILDLFKAAAATRLAIRGDAGQNRLISYRTGALQRFGLYVNNTAESGSNAGSDFAIRAYNDAGTLLSTPLFIERSTGNVGIGTTTPTTTLDVSGTLRVTGDSTLADLDLKGLIPSLDFVFSPNTAFKHTILGANYASSPVSSNYMTFKVANGANTQVDVMTLNGAGSVGIGTTSPTKELEVSSTSGATLRLKRDDISVTTDEPIGTVEFFTNDADGPHIASYVQGLGADQGGNFGRFGAMAFGVSITSNTDAVEVARFDPFGYFRLSTNSPGIQFNGDTAAANALDDYEEGTFTPSIAFGGASVGITYFDRQGNYTKIGRQVTCTIYLALTAVGSSTGNATIEGLPFTCGNLNRGNIGACSFRFANITFSGQLMGNVSSNSTIIELSTVTLLGVQTALTNSNFNGSSEFNAITVTYFV